MRYKIALRQVVGCLLLLVVCSTASAALELELTQGIDTALPIAIVPFAGENTDPGAAELTQTIISDLQNSGQFRVINDATADRYSETATAVNYVAWRKKHIDNLVLGKIEKINDNSIRVMFQLLETVGNKNILLNKEFTIRPRDYRRLAHHISDLIYKELTGEKGIFSTRVAYISVQRETGQPTKYRLYVADADGHNPRALLISSQPIMSPSWSPDGKQIAYVSFEKRKAEVYTVDVHSGKRRLITSFSGINGAPAWSPDGNELAVVLSKSGSPNIYLINMQTHRMRQLTHDYAINTEPSFSPDGKSIIFTSNRGGSPQIYKIDLASTQVSRVTFDGNYNARASYTPDGKSIVMLHSEGGRFNIAIQDLASGRVDVLTRAGQSESPTIAPNGKMILYATNYGGNGVLSVVSVDNKVRLRLPSTDSDVQEPAWSPFIS